MKQTIVSVGLCICMLVVFAGCGGGGSGTAGNNKGGASAGGTGNGAANSGSANEDTSAITLILKSGVDDYDGSYQWDSSSDPDQASCHDKSLFSEVIDLLAAGNAQGVIQSFDVMYGDQHETAVIQTRQTDNLQIQIGGCTARLGSIADTVNVHDAVDLGSQSITLSDEKGGYDYLLRTCKTSGSTCSDLFWRYEAVKPTDNQTQGTASTSHYTCASCMPPMFIDTGDGSMTQLWGF